TVSYADTGLAADQTYSYYIAAYIHASSNSNTAVAGTYSAAPSDPSALSVNVSGADDVLSWTDNSTNEAGSQIERSTDDLSFSQIATTSANLASTASYTDAGSSGTLYYYRVRAYNTKGDSGYSNSNFASDRIVFDNVTSQDASGSTSSLTFSHVVTSAANRILFVGVRVCCTTGLISSVTYNGTALTFVDSREQPNPDAGAAYLYYLTNPPSGTGTVSITLTGPHFFIGTAVSYAGVAQANPIDVEGTNAAQVSMSQAYTQSVTTTVNDD